MKTMIKILFLLFVCMAMSVQAEYVLWVGVDKNAVVHAGENTYSIQQFANIVGQPMANMGGRILVDGVAMPAGYEHLPREIPPRVDFDDDFSEFGLAVVDDYDVWTGSYADWQPIKLGEENPTTLDIGVIFEIGYWDENDDWNFIPLGSSNSFPLSEMDDHYYEAGTLAPPTETPWRPIDFYTDYPVPEPSTTLLTVLGACVCLLSRKG